MYRWWVFVHILGAFGFLLAHGVSVGMALALRREREPVRIQALLGLSRVYLNLTYASLLVLLIGASSPDSSGTGGGGDGSGPRWRSWSLCGFR